jgi:protein regulator of cytokinesis 1
MMRGQKGEKRDPTRLLREEKMRKRIAKELPKVAVDLRKSLERWEDEYGRPFLVHGERYLDELEASEAKAAPGPRSRTPAAPPPALGKSQQKPTPASRSRANSTMRPPPSRAGAKTPISQDTIKRNPLASSVSAAGGRTPSRIPARAPLSSLKHGNNSPERKAQADKRGPPTGTIRSMGPPARAPPPKMRELFEPVRESAPVSRGESVESNIIVRHVPPEDVYDDRNYEKYSPDFSNPDSYSSSMRQDERAPKFSYPPNPASRQISGTSASTTTVSGSENWETYDDVSEPEQDASDDYYARLRAARCKRFTPEDGYAPPQGVQMKKQKGYPPELHAGQMVIDSHGNRIVSGSEANWTDEDAF